MRGLENMKFMSPFRYPGGKSKLLAGYIMPSLQRKNGISEHFVDVFVGGGSVALAVADTNPTAQIHMNDKDTRVAAFWKVTSSDRVNELIDKLDVEPTLDLFYDTRSKQFTNDVDLAFQAIFLNRTAYSGMLNAGPMGGRQQNGDTKINSRYNFRKLKDKILACNQLLTGRTIVTSKDFRDVLSETSPYTATYLDPPYVVDGNKLYSVGMSHEDHRDLAEMLKHRNNWLLSYDDCDLPRSLYSPEEISTIPVRYCIANNWSKRGELLIEKIEMDFSANHDSRYYNGVKYDTTTDYKF